jgi:hypothetical protein
MARALLEAGIRPDLVCGTSIGAINGTAIAERLGARPALPPEVTHRIVTERVEGRTFQAIADGLMVDGLPTARGKSCWYPATIRAIVTSDNAAPILPRQEETGKGKRRMANRHATAKNR